MRRALLVITLALVAPASRAQEGETAPAPSPEAAPDAAPEAAPEPAAPPPEAPVDRPPPPTDPAEGPEAAAPATGEPGDDGGGDRVTLRISADANAALARCVALQGSWQPDEAERCLDDVLAHHADTTAALRASALLEVLRLQRAANASEPPPPGALDGAPPSVAEPSAPAEGRRFQIPPGRLELSSTAGLFGVWNGIAAGVAIAPHLPDANPAGLILGTGALAVGLGVGYGVGGYYLADALDLGEGDSRLVASSLVWGTTFGIAALPALLDIVQPEGDVALSLSLGTVVASGFALGGAGLALASFTDLTTPHVSLINTGGWVGGLFGLLTIASLAPFAPPLPAYSAGYLTVAGSGLVVGALAGMVLDLSWGETLLLDLGGVLGTVTAAAVVMSVTASGAVNAVPSTVLIPASSAITAAGTLGGIGLGLAATRLLQGEGGSVFKPFGEGVTLLPAAPSFVVDREGELAPMLLAPTIVF